VFSTGLNILLNTAVVSFVIHPVFAAAYAVSLGLCAALLWASRRRNESLAVEAQGSSVRFTGIMLRIWDNVLLANSFNLRHWRENAESSFQAARRDRLESVNFTQAMSGATTLLAMLPIAAAVIWFLAVHPSGSPETASMLITIPRLFVVLTVTFRLVSLAFGWVSHIARVREIFDGLERQAPSAADLHSQIDFSRITAQGEGGAARAVDLTGLEELLSRPGRLTIRGENGAGKTALLLKLKERLSDRAAYIPAHHDLDVGGRDDARSTGQRARIVLTEIFRGDPSPVILLDEWDANLDEANREALSRRIDRESKERCIVEVVHG
jgi:ABC-type transport system involved in cytochrome bd biosynthesis fused ATPase/permease subunit